MSSHAIHYRGSQARLSMSRLTLHRNRRCQMSIFLRHLSCMKEEYISKSIQFKRAWQNKATTEQLFKVFLPSVRLIPA